jgi:hypothetical protein
MKKRTKKKIVKFAKKSLKVLGKLLFAYPAQALGKMSQRVYTKIREQPQTPSTYSQLTDLRSKNGTLSNFQNQLLKNKSSIGIILGARGTGKSALGMRLIENIHAKTKKTIHTIGFKPTSLPRWITPISTLDQINNNSIILIDEGGIAFSSRKSMSNANTILSKLLLIARHKDLSVIFITQNSANLEINALRQADYLLLKPSSLLQKDFERKKIRDIYSSVQQDFADLSNQQGLTYIYSTAYQGFVSNNLPSFWNDKISKSYSKSNNSEPPL